MIAPAALIRCFGDPDTSEIFYEGSGQFDFEDSNLDLYSIYDVKSTDFYHGLNREDEFYTGVKNLKKPLYKRKRKWPTIEEFWNGEEPKQFKVSCDDQAEWRKFKRWILKVLENIGDT